MILGARHGLDKPRLGWEELERESEGKGHGARGKGGIGEKECKGEKWGEMGEFIEKGKLCWGKDASLV